MNHLDRFVEAQKDVFQQALNEVKCGEKKTHWMWFIFPQISGLGNSEMAEYYAISGLSEAVEYLHHPVLGSRLIMISKALLAIPHSFPIRIFGQIDAMKLKSSMTLFSIASQESDNVFQQVLDKYFEGQSDEKTLKILNL